MRRIWLNVAAVITVTVLAGDLPASAQQPSSADTNAANNPLTPKITINFHDQVAPELYDLDQASNAFLFRGVVLTSLAECRNSFDTLCPSSRRRTGKVVPRAASAISI